MADKYPRTRQLEQQAITLVGFSKLKAKEEGDTNIHGYAD